MHHGFVEEAFGDLFYPLWSLCLYYDRVQLYFLEIETYMVVTWCDFGVLDAYLNVEIWEIKKNH